MQSQWEMPLASGLPPPADAEEVTASHILKKHVESRRPVDWRGRTVTRSKEQARKELERIREDIKMGARDFGEAALDESDCSSARRRGNLGPFARGTMQKPFEDCAFSLKVGELSQIIETQSGLHIILRTA